jgi:hypothetical protein
MDHFPENKYDIFMTITLSARRIDEQGCESQSPVELQGRLAGDEELKIETQLYMKSIQLNSTRVAILLTMCNSSGAVLWVGKRDSWA